MIYLISYLVLGVLSVIYAYFNRGNGQSWYYNLFLIQLVGNISFFGFFNFIGHVLLRKKVAQSIGWVTNGFQIELGIVSLGIGICGILSYWFRDGFWLATLIPVAVFLIGAGVLHIKEMMRDKNFNSGNVTIIMPDFLIPLTLGILYILSLSK
ncbi:DUF6790 family protein [Lapidilactobacillus gannanensis]|uniref:DUF6790 family protein n=1 Tax=Lapidilactobacillus gannanensis TaxID=2486002 RepID=A0ABW4BNS9_9LACO|nr:DUF6790 family protein [Lapidilactobacillus gannanensis]